MPPFAKGKAPWGINGFGFLTIRRADIKMQTVLPWSVDSWFESFFYCVEKLALRHVVGGAADNPACNSEKASQS